MRIWLRRGLLCILLLLSLLIALLLSHHGNVLLINLAKHFVPQLELELDEGALLFSPKLSGIAWQDEQVDLMIDQLSYRFDWGCLAKAICVDGLTVKGVDANFHPLQTAEPAPTSSGGLPDSVAIPIGLRIEGVDISDVSYQQPGLAVNLSQLLFSAQVNQRGATLSPIVNGLTVRLTPTENAAQAEPTVSSTPTNKEALVLPTLKAPLPIHIPQLSLSQFTLEQGETPFHLTRFYISVSWVEHELTVEDLELVLPELSAKLQAQVSLRNDWPLTADLSAKLLADPFLDGQLVGQKLRLSAAGDTKKLSTDLTLTGPVKLNLKGWSAPLSARIDHQQALTWQKLQWPLTGAPQFTLKQGEVNSKGNLDNFNVNLATSVFGEGLPDVDLSGQVQGNLEKINVKQLLAKTLSGEVSLVGKLDLADQLAWRGDLDLSNIDSTSYFPDYPAQLNGQLSHSFVLQGSHWQLGVEKLDLHGKFMEQPLKVAGKVSGNDRLEWKIDNLVVINGKNQVTAMGHIKDKVDLLLNINVPDISSSLPDIAGNLQGDVKVAGELTAPKVNIDLTGNKIVLGELSLASLSLKADVLASKQPSGHADLEIKQLKQPGIDVDMLRLTASGSDLSHQVTLKVDGQPVATELALSGRWQNQGWQGQLQQAWFSTIEGRWQLDQPSQISYRNKQVVLAKQCWSSAPSLFCLQPTKAGESGETGLVVEHYDLGRLQQFLPELMKLQGVIQTNVTAKWTKGAKPTARFDVNSRDINVTFLDDNSQEHAIPVTTLTLTGELDKTLAKFVLNLDTDKLGNADIDLTLQPYTAEKLLQGKFFYQGLNLKALHYLAPNLDELAGDVSLDINVNGPLKAPIVKGIAQLKDAALGGGSVPMYLSDLNTEIKLNGTKGTVAGGFNTGDGSGQIDGAFDWQKGLNAWITLKGDRIEVDYQSQVQLFISPDLKFILDDKKMDLTGNILVPKGMIAVKTLPPSAVSISDDVVVVDSGTAIDEAANLPLKMKLGVQLGDDVKIDAFGLKSNLKGQLAVTKKVDGPILTNGNIRLVNGSYRAFGQNLLIRKGVLLFSGPPDQPYLSVNAIRDPALITDNVTAGIKLEGPVSAPEITIYSTPAMDQQNALSYLLRGKGIDSRAGDDSMMTSMLINLGVGQSADTVSQIGEALGVKDLALDSSGSGDNSQLNITGYILPGVQIRYGIGLFSSMTEIALRYEVMPRLYLEAVSGLYSAFDVYYQFDWD
ncbi:translocation/assembly module TamB domain-containing protein [Motilimonas sp. 1_MG-2023]|uniref:autotransporter assembly complex protein TamB n=1 Tax=Motilimonas sp. 1_MG-2023 TaxID=3062672 RepID=UPI0026E123CF|nr:translocation/assembly module TamB domain-containing protein [Motilimonas sp. 1_MG-2023]MDO6526552.1 translocation/assembly module TamB domain-containing protein [Motilimonas sp. 1_MG-2023]